MDNSAEMHPAAPLVHGKMIYRCEECGKSWPMYLEKGIEEFEENYKPFYFAVICPCCGDWVMYVSGSQEAPDGRHMPLPDGAGYFANVENEEYGIPIFPVSPMDEVESLLQDEDVVNAIECVKGNVKAETIEGFFRMFAIDIVYPIKEGWKHSAKEAKEAKEAIIGIIKSVGILATVRIGTDAYSNGGDLAWDKPCFALPPPLSKLERLWRTQRRRADRERWRVLLKYLEWLYFIKRRKAYATGRSNCDSAVLPGYSTEDQTERAENRLLLPQEQSHGKRVDGKELNRRARTGIVRTMEKTKGTN